ncbi:MAG: hypothetical protein OXH75_12410 [Acidobacteria bacterium]|nr:hypothetical protein [Acidobacteriota bacterium]
MTGRTIAHLGLGCGGACLVVVAVQLGGAPDWLPSIDSPPTNREVLGIGAVTVLGTVLVAVGVVGLLLDTGVFTAATRQAAERDGSRGHPAAQVSAATAADRRAPSEILDSPARLDAVEPPTKRTVSERLAARAPADTAPLPRADGQRAWASERRAAESRKDAERTDDDRPAGRQGRAPGENRVGQHQVGEPAAVRHDAAEPETAAQEGLEEVVRSPPQADLSPSVPVPQPGDLVAAWDDYRRTGDGHFNARGLQRVLDERGIGATVGGGDRIAAGGSVLIVETPSRQAHFYVLPSFAKSPRAVADWFDDGSSGVLTGRTERVLQIAEGRWTRMGFEVTSRGQVA